MLRDAGAAEVHLRISSPPFSWPCFYGIDTPDRDELLAANHDAAPRSSATSTSTRIAYITLENLKEAIGADGAGFCDACLTGHYPVPVPVAAAADRAGPGARAEPTDGDLGRRPPGGAPGV